MKLAWPALAIAVAALFACGRNNDSPQGSGLIEATEITVSVETSGRLDALCFTEGDIVLVGDTLAALDTSAVMIRLRQARAAADGARARLENTTINIQQAANNLELANKEFERIASLIKTGSANQQQYDRVQTAFEQAKLANRQAEVAQTAARADLNAALSQIELLEKQIADCFPISPVSGVIVEKFVDPGELLAIGKPLVRIARPDTVWVKIYLPPADLTRISLGSHASVDPEDGRAHPFDGVVTWISSEAEFTPKNVQTREARAGLVYAVKITIPNPGQILKIGMPVSIIVK
jgi:HlyD family secretion protein